MSTPPRVRVLRASLTLVVELDGTAREMTVPVDISTVDVIREAVEAGVYKMRLRVHARPLEKAVGWLERYVTGAVR